ncbi:MAG: hypothetical protein ACXV2H_09295 [Actinomycetes bacterium]
MKTCTECETFIDTRCAECDCCNHSWQQEDVCQCMTDGCGCRENREWDEGEL